MIPSPGKDRGFTLIEILVVVIIIAIISSIGLMSMNLIGDDRELNNERDRLASLIEIAQDEATMQGRELGIELMSSTYRFVEYDPYSLRWSEITGDDLFRLRQLPDGMEFQLYLEDKLIVLESDPQELEQSSEAETDDEALVSAINESGADILLLGLGNPKQELWFNRNRHRLDEPAGQGQSQRHVEQGPEDHQDLDNAKESPGPFGSVTKPISHGQQEAGKQSVGQRQRTGCRAESQGRERRFDGRDDNDPGLDEQEHPHYVRGFDFSFHALSVEPAREATIGRGLETDETDPRVRGSV